MACWPVSSDWGRWRSRRRRLAGERRACGGVAEVCGSAMLQVVVLDSVSQWLATSTLGVRVCVGTRRADGKRQTLLSQP